MSYKTILVHLELNGDNQGVIGVAAQLAERFAARVIGIAAAQPFVPLYEEGAMIVDVALRDKVELERELAACHAQFRKALEHRVQDIGWRSAITLEPLADYIAEEARCADLIVTGKDIGGDMFDHRRRVNVGDLAFRAGRPILIVPPGINELALKNVFLGWKDTREARRAALDALPLLDAAGHVTLLEVTSQDGQRFAETRLRDVALWLERHKIAAKSLVVGTKGNQAGHLHAALKNHQCDLLIAGAYGHNRLGEWAFGGVTQDVLLDPEFCVLLSH